MNKKVSSESVVKDIRRRTRKKYSSEEKIRIVLDGLRGEDSISSLCRREGILAKKSQKFSLRQPIHILSKPYPWDSLLGGGGIRFKPRKTVCQLCANLVGISWHLLTQYATSVSASLINIYGAVAQLGAHLNGIQGVRGSIPLSSTIYNKGLTQKG